MSSIIQCPHCHREFINEPLEELTDTTLAILQRSMEFSSWEEITNLIDSGEIHRLLRVGDQISFSLKDGSKATVNVLDIDPYGGGEVVFGFQDSFGDYQMNKNNTNAGGFPNSIMPDHLKKIEESLPDDLLSVITPRRICQKPREISYEITAKLWLPSLYEVFGADYASRCCDIKEVRYSFFKNQRNRMKFQRDGDTSIYWWLRSPNVGNTTNFWYVNNNGNVGNTGASNTNGVCPCFVICKRDVRTLHEPDIDCALEQK